MMNRAKVMAQLSETLSRVNASYEKIALKYNISYTLLMIFYILDNEDYVTQKDVCDKLFLSKSTINGLLKDLKGRGYVDLVLGKNKKEKRIVFTEIGEKINRSIQEDTDKFESSVLEYIGKSEISLFLEQAEKISWKMSEEVLKIVK